MGKDDKRKEQEEKAEGARWGSIPARLVRATCERPTGPITCVFVFPPDCWTGFDGPQVTITIGPDEDPWECLQQHLRAVGHLVVGQVRNVDIRKRG